MPYCPDCGATADPTDARCRSCGERLQDDEAGGAPAATPEPERADSAVALPSRSLGVPAFGIKYAFAAGASPPLLVGVVGLVAGAVALLTGAVTAFGVLAMAATYGVLLPPLAVLLVPVVLATGYAIRLTEATARGSARPPALEDYYETAVDGCVALLALLPWALATGLIATLARSVFPPLAIPAVLAALLPLPAIWTLYAARGVLDAYNPARLARTMATSAYAVGTLSWILVGTALSFAAAVASLVLVTVPFVWPFVAFVGAAHWGAVAYLLDLVDEADDAHADTDAAGARSDRDGDARYDDASPVREATDP